jgi:hypothetical protein
LAKWRDQKKLREVISEDNEDEASLFFEHGMDVNLFFDK